MERIPFSPYDFLGYLSAGLFVLIGMQFTLGFPPILDHDFAFVDTAMLLIATYVTGQLVATPAKALYEDFIVARLLGRPSVILFQDTKPRLRGLLFPGFYKPLPESRRRKILERTKAKGAEKMGEDLFLYVRYHSVIVADDKLMARLNAFLNQYGFSRNLSFASVTIGTAWLIRGAVYEDHQLWNYGIVAVVVGVLLLYRYLKFFRQYSYELFNSYAGKLDRIDA